MVEEKVEVIYGGGATGLMGQLADTILEKGGKIKGIMPKFMNEHTKKSLTLNLLKPCKSEKVSFWRELMAW